MRQNHNEYRACSAELHINPLVALANLDKIGLERHFFSTLLEESLRRTLATPRESLLMGSMS